jgi:hypothetical protein
MQVDNNSGVDTGVHANTTPSGTGTGSHAIGPRSTAQPAKVWTHCPAGASLEIPAPSSGTSTVEFQLANGRTLVQAVDARTERVELRRDADGSYRTVVTSAPILPRAAAGGR